MYCMLIKQHYLVYQISSFSAGATNVRIAPSNAPTKSAHHERPLSDFSDGHPSVKFTESQEVRGGRVWGGVRGNLHQHRW